MFLISLLSATAARDHKREHVISLPSFPFRKGTRLLLKILLLAARKVKAKNTNVRLVYSKIIVLILQFGGRSVI